MTYNPEFYTEPELLAKEENLNELVQEVRLKVLEKKAEFPCSPRTDRDFLVKFIRCKKYQPDDAIKAIEKYYKNIFDLCDLLQHKYPQYFESIYKTEILQLLKNRIHGQFVTKLHIGSWNPNIHSFEDILVATGFCFEELWNDKYHQLNGFTTLFDVSGFSLSHARNMTYHNIKIVANCLFEMNPLRVKAVHFINSPRIFWPIYLIIKKLLPKKLQSRVYLHKNVTSLAQALNPEVLPVSLGGVLTEDDAWSTEPLSKLLTENKSYESHWNATTDC